MEIILKNNLKQIRKRKNMSQKELATKAGLTQNTISSIENRSYNPSCLTAFMIAGALSMKFEDIFYT